ncbi:SPIN1 protein, partial [Amia calva]|nr:SPIN1 protein [Amia calva]
MGLDELKLPKVTHPDQLLGKRVKHGIEENEKKNWYKGTVIAMREEGRGQTFKLKYDECQMTWWFDLWKDFQQDNVKLLPLTAHNLLGKKVEHMFVSSEDGAETWWPGRVLRCTDDRNSFVIEYEDEEVDSEGTKLFEYPLLDDYINNELRILS